MRKQFSGGADSSAGGPRRLHLDSVDIMSCAGAALLEGLGPVLLLLLGSGRPEMHGGCSGMSEMG